MTSKIIVTVLLGSVLVGCNWLTDVDAPDVVQPGSVANAAGADALRAGVLTRFTNAYSGSLSALGLITDELFSTRPAGAGTSDPRSLPEQVDEFGYQGSAFQAARINGLRAIAAYHAYAPMQRTRTGQMFAVVGYTEVFFAEHYCSGVPLSRFLDEPEFGTPLTTAQLFEQAAADFDSAIVYAETDARIANLGRVGRGRALLGLGRYDEAAAVVAAVPTSFVYQTEHSAAVQPNGLATQGSNQWTVADGEGGNGLDFRSADDLRIPLDSLGKGLDGATDVYRPSKYNSVASPITLASGTEARLIEAETLLRNGQAQAALDRLNALRATVPGLAPLALEATTAAQVDQLFRERAFWLFLTGTRLGDLRRLIRQYGRTAESVFPTGAYRDGLTYGTDVNFPIAPSEFNNPNFHGCLDRAS